MQCLLQQFRDFYEEKLTQVDEKWSTSNATLEDIQELKIEVLRSYINDLAEQNLALVETAEELQKETENRVALIEQILQKTTIASKAYMYKIHDYQQQLQKYNSEKVKATSLLQLLQTKCQIAEEERNLLRDQNANLSQDVSSLIHLISQSRSASNWESNSENCEANSENNLSPIDRLSTSDSCFVRHSPTEFQCKDCSFVSEDFSRSSVQNGVQRKSSTPSISLSCLSYDGVYSQVARPTEKDVLIKRLQVDLKYAQKSQRDASMKLLEKDHTIATLQCQITDLRHEMSVKDCECEGHLQLIAQSQEQQRRTSIELSHYDETVRQLQRQMEDSYSIIQKSSVTLNGGTKCKLSEVDSVMEKAAKKMCVLQTDVDDRELPINCAISDLSGDCDSQDTHHNGSDSVPQKLGEAAAIERNLHEHKISATPYSESVTAKRKLDSSTQTCAIVDKTDSLAEIQDLKNELRVALSETSNLRKCVTNRDESILQLEQRLEEVQNKVQQYENSTCQDLNEHSSFKKLQEEMVLVQQERDSHAVELSKLQEELSYVEAAAQEMRGVLAREIAERHDTIKALRQELADQTDHHKEMVQQLVLKTVVIKDLRKEAKLAQTKVDEKALAEKELQETIKSLEEQVEKKALELENQMITIGNLQQALVQSKRGIVEAPPTVSAVNGTTTAAVQPKQRVSSRDVFDI